MSKWFKDRRTNEMTVFLLLHPAIIYHCDLTKEPLQPHIFREVTVKGFNPSDYQTTQVTRISPFDTVSVSISLCTQFASFQARDPSTFPLFFIFCPDNRRALCSCLLRERFTYFCAWLPNHVPVLKVLTRCIMGINQVVRRKISGRVLWTRTNPSQSVVWLEVLLKLLKVTFLNLSLSNRYMIQYDILLLYF